MKLRIKDITAVLLAALLMVSCTSGDEPEVPDYPEFSRIALSVSLPGSEGASRAASRGDFDNFDNQLDKWGREGENIEELRIVILDSNGNVEVNEHYSDLNNITRSDAYTYQVRNNDRKTVLLVANETGCNIHTDTGEKISATEYFDGHPRNSYIDMKKLALFTLHLDDNLQADSRGKNMNKPLPITAIHSELIQTTKEEDTVKREYVMHRAAVKFSFRIINKSDFNHTFEGVRVSRFSDREYFFPNAEYGTNDLGHQVMTSYSTPASAEEAEYKYEGFNVSIPKGMTEAIEPIAPIYLPEGKTGTDPYSVSITLNGAPLAIWGVLNWRRPEDPETSKGTPMLDLPRNCHVVVNITILDDNTYTFDVDVQPYSVVELRPNFGFERDENGNIIINRNPDGTYEVIENGERVIKDADGDEVIKHFKDGSIYCCEKVYKDYLHDGYEVDYIFYFEKDRLGGNMIIIRETNGGKADHHNQDLDNHDHDIDDRAMFVLTKEGQFLYVTWSEDGKPTYHDRDRFGDEIIQVNGQQFQNDSQMGKYIGTYVVKRKSDGVEVLRYYKDGSEVDWNTGLANKKARIRSTYVSPSRKKRILDIMRTYNQVPFINRR